MMAAATIQRGAVVALLLVASCSGGQGQVICPAGTRPMYGTTMQERYSVAGDPSSVDLCAACYPGRFRETPAQLLANPAIDRVLVTDSTCELCPVGKASGGGGAPCADCAAPLSAAPQTINGVVFERSFCKLCKNVHQGEGSACPGMEGTPRPGLAGWGALGDPELESQYALPANATFPDRVHAFYESFTERKEGACLNPDEWGYGAADYGGPLTFLARIGIAALVLLLFLRWQFRAAGEPWARSHCRFALPRIQFILDSLTYSVPLLLKRQCDRTLGEPPSARFIAPLEQQPGARGQPDPRRVPCLPFSLLAPSTRLCGCVLQLLPAPARPCEFLRSGMWQGSASGSVAVSLCTTAHPLRTRFAKRFGVDVAEGTMRPDP